MTRQIEISRTIDDDGLLAVMVATDDYALILPPGDAVEIGETIIDVARAIQVDLRGSDH